MVLIDCLFLAPSSMTEATRWRKLAKCFFCLLIGHHPQFDLFRCIEFFWFKGNRDEVGIVLDKVKTSLREKMIVLCA